MTNRLIDKEQEIISTLDQTKQEMIKYLKSVFAANEEKYQQQLFEDFLYEIYANFYYDFGITGGQMIKDKDD